MFETEDMLPRTAPKPILGLNEPAVKPTVPEVSILFNQATTTSSNNPTQQNKPPLQSYAAWRKQMLPKVTYPPGADSDNNTVVKSNLYPMRNYTPTAATSRNNIDNGAYAYINKNETQAQQQRRSLESYAPVYSNAQITTAVSASSNPNLVQLQQQEQQYMRRSLETLPVQRSMPPSAASTAMPQTPIIRPLSSATDVLTICAGTQTDSIGMGSQCNNADVATKQDYQQLLGILQEMRLEQQRLTEICVLLIEQQQQRFQQPTLTENKGVSLKDASTQYDEAVQATPSQQQHQAVLIKDYHAAEQYKVEQPTPNNFRQKCLQNVQPQQQLMQQNFQSPRVRPAAHSTGYRTNSPLVNNNKPQQQQQNAAMSKPATEQSMVMNELALKYLPNDKLNEMYQEMHISPTTQQKVIDVDYATATPLRNIENIDKGPNDISNASYKYLKKYRLLSEDQQNQHHQQQQQQISPLLQNQQKQQFQRERSPLAGHPRAMQEHLLDLDAIRRQPKFL